ncbi:hypothetical protein JXM83_05795 [Candidatus Woesearchaeota archaeon]|nr:hypothetical protein [Candidatus Woesearchaeota archaeon]
MISDNAFYKRKKYILEKLKQNDKSRQGHVDEEIIYLVNTINDKKNIYTTSSCAGRILVTFRPETKNKADVIWVYKSHKPSEFETIIKQTKEFVESNTKKGLLSFKQEPMIIHVATKDIETAHELITIACDSGFKKKGVISIGKRIITEITSSKTIEFPIGEDNKIYCDENHLKWIINKANQNIKTNKTMIDKLEKTIKQKDI